MYDVILTLRGSFYLAILAIPSFSLLHVVSVRVIKDVCHRTALPNWPLGSRGSGFPERR